MITTTTNTSTTIVPKGRTIITTNSFHRYKGICKRKYDHKPQSKSISSTPLMVIFWHDSFLLIEVPYLPLLMPSLAQILGVRRVSRGNHTSLNPNNTFVLWNDSNGVCHVVKSSA